MPPEWLPHPSFCLHNHSGCSWLGLSVPVSCFRSPTSQQDLIRLLLQLDSIPYFWCPPAGLGAAATTGSEYHVSTAPSSCLNNRGGEHGRLWLNVPILPWDSGEAFDMLLLWPISQDLFAMGEPTSIIKPQETELLGSCGHSHHVKVAGQGENT